MTEVKRVNLLQRLFPSVLSGILLGVLAAVSAVLLVAIWYPENYDAQVVAAYSAWTLFFFIGIGAFNGVARWGFARRDATPAEELYLAGKDQGFWRYFRYTTDHKVVGMQYLFTVLVMFLLGSMGAFLIRLEQSRPGAVFLTPSTYNTIVGMHGILMIAATVVMISGPFGNFVLPIMIGARDMAFPRLNALSYWLLFAAIPVFFSTMFLGGFPTGWTGYAPLSVQELTPGMDAYCFTIILFAISTTVAALNIVTTVLVLRARGMTWGRLPIFVWGVLLSVVLGLTAFPSFLMSQVMVVMDRVFQTSFFVASFGGSNWLYEHMFWFMGHPEVYVIALPAMAVAAEVTSVFTRKPVFGYRMMIGSLAGISVLSVLVWGHHLYTSGSAGALNSPYMLDTELISVPTGVFFLGIIGTLWRGKIWMTVPLLFVAGMLVNFVIGGVTGIYLADLPTDEILHGGMFVTAHFHFTLVGSMVFGFFAGLYYWFPKMLGRRLNPVLGRLHFWLFEIGFLGTFLSLFYAGLQGEPRWSANVAQPYAMANLVASLFAILIAASVFVLVCNVVMTLLIGERAQANEWGARTLEWTVPTPVPLENFEYLPEVKDLPYDYASPAPVAVEMPSVLPSTPRDYHLPASLTDGGRTEVTQESPLEN
ncbi:cytochrome c oxidase subunit I [Dictyobacter aurantiacus]|uniref:Cytochrome c oxidase subunit 1 n=1 Tax=Dictyobacter aurantiacus TaxID=1936993 RepID=A0A401ZIR1_9CHLR|nr:cbb3-type cytochrome c oxidase subunit I [Dictyobacter aurantiacus]GCE06732.1 cytochrome c oxidase subunit 1 [Dictyobacter aurantiacus]